MSIASPFVALSLSFVKGFCFPFANRRTFIFFGSVTSAAEQNYSILLMQDNWHITHDEMTIS